MTPRPGGRRGGVAGALGGAAVAALASGTAYLAARALPTSVDRRWERTNHAGAPVTLLEGPAYAVGAAAGAALAGPAGVVATLGPAAFGALDDLAGDSTSKGLRGHLGALARGELTTGAVKIVGIGASGLCAAVLADRADRVRGDRSLLDMVLAGGVVAGAANLGNLLDLRPGRALKVVLLTAGHVGARGSVDGAAACGAALALLGPDLRGESMLGDTGANAAGALVGLAAARTLGTRGRLVSLAGLAGLTLLSERVSFTRVIESTPGLRELDAWGRTRR